MLLVEERHCCGSGCVYALEAVVFHARARAEEKRERRRRRLEMRRKRRRRRRALLSLNQALRRTCDARVVL
jgi:hypothetical protein